MPDILYSMISIKKTKEFSEWLESLTWKEQGQINARLERIQSSTILEMQNLWAMDWQSYVGKMAGVSIFLKKVGT